MDNNQLVNVIKTLKKTELVFGSNNCKLRVGKSDIKVEDQDGDELISIYPQIREREYRILYSSPTLDKHGTSTAQELVDFWETNNFFFDIGSQPIADGRVEFRADLPITIGFPAVGAIYLVEKPTTILFGAYTTYQSGLYIKDNDSGSLSDWRRLNVKVKYTSGEWRVVDSTDQSKQLAFDVSAIAASTTRTFSWPDKDGIVALISDFANEGQVKINDGSGVKPTFIFTNPNLDIFQQVTYNSPLSLSASPVTQWPENIISPDENDIYDFVNDTFIENTILGQLNVWRLLFDFSNKSVGATTGIIVRIENTLSGFQTDYLVSIPDERTDGRFSVFFYTIADSASLPAPFGAGQGYELSITSDDPIDIVLDSLTRFNNIKHQR